MSKGRIQIDASRLNKPELPKPTLSKENDLSIEVQEKKTETCKKDRFREKKYEVMDPLEYPRNGMEQGLVIIFNQENFKNPELPRRSGTSNDVQTLITTFGRLKFNIDEEYIFKDLNRFEILDRIEKICKSDLGMYNCLICVFLSHGDKNNTLHTFEGQLKAEEIYEPFANCDGLANKPKLFIFQACKNSKIDNEATDVDGNYNKELVCNRTIQTVIPKDLLLVYSTLEGDVSFRNTAYGTWFIQELCKNFCAYGRRDDVVSLVIRTTKCVASGYHYLHKDDIIKQMPIFISTLTKTFYLCISKDRLQLLNVIEQKRKSKKYIDELIEKISNLK